MDIPVLLLVYNRPLQTKWVIDRLKSCGVKRVYVSADGPKNSGDATQTNHVLELLSAEEIVLKINYSKVNLGCKTAVTKGIDWFFQNEEKGIILEDDCLPSVHFFQFMGNMLNRYQKSQKVKMISGNNPLGTWSCEGGHFFSRFGHVWGWATWKDRWEEFDVELPQLKAFITQNGFEKNFGPTELSKQRKEFTLKSVSEEIDTWDYQWNAHILMENGVAVIPEKNLVENIGFELTATNDTDLPKWINNDVSAEAFSVSDRVVQADLEYEMEWHLARQSNSNANRNSKVFEKIAERGKSKLRIAIINSTDVGGGAEKIAFSLHQQLLQREYESNLFVAVKKSNLETVFQVSNLKEQLADFKPDVVHIHNLHGTGVSLEEMSNVVKQIPTLFTLHDSWLTTGSTSHPFHSEPEHLSLIDLRKWNQKRDERKRMVKESGIRFTAPSQWLREKFFHVHRLRPYFVPNATEKGDSERVDLPSNRFILFVANKPETNPYKDFNTLELAWAKANERLGSNGVDLIVIGGNSRIEKRGQFHIHFIENSKTEVVQRFMEKAELLVQASKQDNAPLTVLEPHSSNTKVVGSLVGGIPELLGNRERKWLAEPGNVEELATSIIDGLQDAGDSFPTHPTIETMVNTYLGHYYDLIGA